MMGSSPLKLLSKISNYLTITTQVITILIVKVGAVSKQGPTEIVRQKYQQED